MSDTSDGEDRWAQLRAGVNPDGTVDECVVETYLAFPLELLHPQQWDYTVDFKNRYIAMTIDNGGVNTEVRLPFELVEQMAKWVAEANLGSGEAGASARDAAKGA